MGSHKTRLLKVSKFMVHFVNISFFKYLVNAAAHQSEMQGPGSLYRYVKN